MAEDPALANVFATRSGCGGSNRIADSRRTNKVANMHLPDAVSNQEVYGTVLEASYSVAQGR